MDELRERIRIFVDKFPHMAFGCVLVIAVIFLCVLLRLDQDYTEEEYAAAKEKILSEIDDETLCSDLYDTVYRKVYSESGVEYVDEEALVTLNKSEYTSFVLYDFYQITKEDGVGGYFYDTDFRFVEEIGDLLESIGLNDLAEAYRSFFSNANFQKEDFLVAVEEPESLYKVYRVKELYELYPSMEDFDYVFSEEVVEDFIHALGNYGRTNIDAYEYGGISERKLEAELLSGL